MSGRCKSCDSLLEEWEMKMVDPATSKYTEFCVICLEEGDIFEDWVELDNITTEDPL
jgi:hypothetical protein